MILANVRQQLTRDDAQLLLRLAARGSSYEQAEIALRERGIDSLLDDPRVLSGLLAARQATHASLPLVSYVIVRHALLEMGERDRALADYVAAVLMEFGMRGRSSRISHADDEQYDTIASMVRDIESADARRSFLVRAHMGNYALWLSGLFPDHIEYRRHRRGGPDLDYYEEMGRRGFTLAAEHRLASENGMATLFRAVADAFSRLRVALNRVSDELLFPSRNSPDRLLRQVKDDFRWRMA
jgi:hypothetical protein